jgi:hypothetical protein
VARHRPIMMGRRPFEHDDTGTPGAGIGVGGRER